jgi:hypothetical protein
MFLTNKHSTGLFSPLTADAIVVSEVTGVTPEQLPALTAPFVPGQAITSLATLQNFTVTCTADANAPATRHLEVYIWVIGTAATYVAQSYLPVPGSPVKSKLWRLGPEVHGGAGEGLSVACTLPSPVQVARLQVVPRGVYQNAALEPPEPVYPE